METLPRGTPVYLLRFHLFEVLNKRCSRDIVDITPFYFNKSFLEMQLSFHCDAKFVKKGQGPLSPKSR